MKDLENTDEKPQEEVITVKNPLSEKLREKHGKNVSLRLKENERLEFDSFAKSLGLTRTAMIRRAVSHYKKYREVQKESVVSAAQDLLAVKTGSADFDKVINHKLSKRIYSKGLTIKDDKGNTITRIKNLHSLMEFLDTKVFFDL